MEQRLESSAPARLSPPAPASAAFARLLDGLQIGDADAAAAPDRADELRLGTGSLWTIGGAGKRIAGGQSMPHAHGRAPFKLLFQLSGSACVTQAGRKAQLCASMFTLIDGQQPFSLEMPGAHQQILVQLPRSAVVARHRGIERRTAVARGSDHAGDALLLDFVMSLARRADALRDGTGLHAQGALLELLSGAEQRQCASPQAALVQRALVIIEMEFASALTAEQLAQRLGVSRRHLDALFARSGRTVSRAIWDCRLQRAAAQLRSPARQPTGIAELGYSLGFQDPAHFARAFRKRFGASPSAWRSGAGSPQDERP
ncbi:MAG TPA: helix-turn-helix domain-containing protein [Burkholderiaceae bacterium]